MTEPSRQPIPFQPEAHTDFVVLVVPESRWFAAILALAGGLAFWCLRRRRVR